MDPNQALSDVLDAFREYQSVLERTESWYAGSSFMADDLERVRNDAKEGLQALADWIGTGGFMPAPVREMVSGE